MTPENFSTSTSSETEFVGAVAPQSERVSRDAGVSPRGNGGTPAPHNLAPDAAAMLEFGRALALSLFCAAIIHPDSGAIRTKSCAANGLPELVEALADANAQGWNVYIQPNPPRRFFNGSERPKKTDIFGQCFAHVDIDPKRGEDRDSERARIFAANPEGVPSASIVVDSGNGAQRYWRLADLFVLATDTATDEEKIRAAERAEVVNHGLAERFDGDRATTDVSRLLRWAGSVNHPSKSKRERGYVARMSRMVENHPERVTRREELPRPTPSEMTKPAAKVAELPDELEPIFSDSLGQWLEPKYEALARVGDIENRFGRQDNDRSADVFAFTCECVRKKMPAARILGVLVDAQWKISDHVLEQRGSKGYAIRQIRKATREVAKEDRAAMPEGAIVLADGRLNENLALAQTALLAKAVPFYERGGEVVRPVRLDRSENSGGIRRDAGATIIVPVTDRYCVQRLSDAAQFVRLTAKGEPAPADPPLEFARHLLDRQGEWAFPSLRGIVNCPTMRRDGSILQSPGFDAASGTIFDPGTVTFPNIPENPTRENAEVALATIEPLFGSFPFDGPASESVVLAAVLTGVARPAMRTVPMFCFDAPTAGSGKSLIAETVAIIATGALPAAMSQGPDDAELEKRIACSLRGGDRVILLDNVERPLGGDTLCSVLSQERVQMRILGRSERVVLDTNATILATGNNLAIAGDLARRAIKARIDSGLERPDQRAFDFDPRDVARSKRPELVAASLTVLRAYVVAGRPVKLPPFGSFEDFNLIRGALVWLGRADPADTRAAIFAADVKRDELGELLTAWRDVFEGSPITLSEVKIRLEATQELAGGVLYGALVDLGSRGAFNARSIGRKLATFIDRPACGLVLRRSESNLGVRWRVECVGRPESAEPVPLPDYGAFAEGGLLIERV